MIPIPISRIPTLISIPHIPIIPIIPLIPSTNSLFRLFQIDSSRYIFQNLNPLLI